MIFRPTLSDEKGLISQEYIDLTPEGIFLEVLKENEKELVLFFQQIPDHKYDFSYAQGKWTIKQILQHIVDVERVMSFRAFVAARGNHLAILPGMDENLYAQNADVCKRTMGDLLEEFRIVRAATRILFRNMTTEESKRTIELFDHNVSARAFAYVIPGHTIHHMNIIRERYL